MNREVSGRGVQQVPDRRDLAEASIGKFKVRP
jgi:hypothetical protein